MVTKLVHQIKVYREVLTSISVIAKILRSLAPKFDHVVVAIEESKDLSTLTKEKLQETLKSHEQRMAKRVASKSKSDVDLQAQSVREKKGKGKRFDNKGRWCYKNLIGRRNQQEGNSLNQRRPSYQSNHIGGVVGKGRDGRRKLDKIYIQYFNCQKYVHYSSDCPEKQKN